MASHEIETLVQALARLPGLGPRSARRAVLYLLKKREGALAPLLRALEGVSDRLATCDICGNVDTTNPCSICNDPRRDARMLCVVEDVPDLWALERAAAVNARYHVLGGHLSPLDGIGPEDLTIGRLVERTRDPAVTEVLLALNATVEGQSTAHYLNEQLARDGLSVSRLAQGVPVGGELDYLDEGTLTAAIRSRRPV